MQSTYVGTTHLPVFVLSSDLSAVALFSILGLALSAAIIPYLPAEALLWSMAMQ
jgi:hypothetical protein